MQELVNFNDLSMIPGSMYGTTVHFLKTLVPGPGREIWLEEAEFG
jgi:hypothetical protein